MYQNTLYTLAWPEEHEIGSCVLFGHREPAGHKSHWLCPDLVL